MRGAFGKPYGTAARVDIGQAGFTGRPGLSTWRGVVEQKSIFLLILEGVKNGGEVCDV